MAGDQLKRQLLSDWQSLGNATAFRVERHPGRTESGIEHNADLPLEVGSCFKAFAAAECCRQVEGGTLRWDERLTLTGDVRVPHSAALGDLADGATVTAREAATAMLSVSDNTATNLILRRIGIESVRRLVADVGLTSTRLPTSVRAVYDAAEMHPTGWAEACVSTMLDLTRFYAGALQGELFSQPATLDAFKTLLRDEDLAQGTEWPAGVVCYRKGGSMVPPPRSVWALAGAFERGGQLVTFVFACNVECPDDTAAAPKAAGFRDGLSRALKTLAVVV